MTWRRSSIEASTAVRCAIAVSVVSVAIRPGGAHGAVAARAARAVGDRDERGIQRLE